MYVLIDNFNLVFCVCDEIKEEQEYYYIPERDCAYFKTMISKVYTNIDKELIPEDYQDGRFTFDGENFIPYN